MATSLARVTHTAVSALQDMLDVTPSPPLGPRMAPHLAFLDLGARDESVCLAFSLSPSVFVFETGLNMQFRLALNLLCSKVGLSLRWSSCLSLPSAGATGVHHHAWS